MVDRIYNHPVWLWGSILMLGAAALACLGFASATASFGSYVDVQHSWQGEADE